MRRLLCLLICFAMLTLTGCADSLAKKEVNKVNNVTEAFEQFADDPSSEKGIKPALNLKSNVIITGGDGTINNPFTLGLE